MRPRAGNVRAGEWDQRGDIRERGRSSQDDGRAGETSAGLTPRPAPGGEGIGPRSRGGKLAEERPGESCNAVSPIR